MVTVIYYGSSLFKYFLTDLFFGDAYEVSEDDFYSSVGYDRNIVPMEYDKDNINRQNFYSDGFLIGYRVRYRVI